MYVYGREKTTQPTEKMMDNQYVTPFQEVSKSEWWGIYEALPMYGTLTTGKTFFFVCPEMYSETVTCVGARAGAGENERFFLGKKDIKTDSSFGAPAGSLYIEWEKEVASL